MRTKKRKATASKASTGNTRLMAITSETSELGSGDARLYTHVMVFVVIG